MSSLRLQMASDRLVHLMGSAAFPAQPWLHQFEGDRHLSIYFSTSDADKLIGGIIIRILLSLSTPLASLTLEGDHLSSGQPRHFFIMEGGHRW